MDWKESFKYLIKEFHETEPQKIIKRALKLPPSKKIMTLVGPRRSGKTFSFFLAIQDLLLKMPKERILYINFEDDRIFNIDLHGVSSLLEAYYELYPENKTKEIYIFLDEIQNITGWETYIRRIYDKEKVSIFITGSSSKLLSREIATSLRGRTLTFEIYPLSFQEALIFNNIKLDKNLFYSKERYLIVALFGKYMRWGGFPEVVLEKTGLEQDILMNYFEVMIYRDIIERFSVRNALLLKELCLFILTNIATPFSINSYYNSVKNQIAVSRETIHEYISYLEEAGIIFLVPLFSYSLKKQQANPKKAYCIDTGLRNALSFQFSKDEGRLAENIVFLELKRRGFKPHYWKNSGEVDFIIKGRDNRLSAINVAYTNEIPPREIDALLEFQNEFKSACKEMLILTKDLEKDEMGIKFVPLWKFLLKD